MDWQSAILMEDTIYSPSDRLVKLSGRAELTSVRRNGDRLSWEGEGGL